MKETKITISGRTRFFFCWPLILTPFVVFLLIVAFLFNSAMLTAIIVFACIYVVFAITWIIIYRKKLKKEIVALAESYNDIQTKQLKSHEAPMAFIDEEGYLIWENDAFKNVTGDEDENLSVVSEVFPEVTGCEEKSFETKYKNRVYRVSIKLLNEEEKISAINLFDITERCMDKKKIEELTPVAIRVCIDNFEEVMKDTENLKRPVYNALIEKKINQYFSERGGMVTNIDKDEYVIYTNNKGLKEIKEDKFSIVEDIKKINYGNKSNATLSIGVGAGSEDLLVDEKNSKEAVELCLARGGDQAIIKLPKNTTYIGGKTEKSGSTSKVKTRMFAQDFLQQLLTKKKVYIMGHANADVDSLGAAVGVYEIAKNYGKDARVLISEPNTHLKPFYDMVQNKFQDIFSSREPVLEEGSLVVVVDVNKPSICEFPEVVRKSKNVVLIDHHRKSEDTLKNPVADLLDSQASSASEMIAEIIELVMKNKMIDEVTATVLYAGIVVDTNNFNTKVGPRTFEAAAFLKKCKADSLRVRKMLRESIDSFREKINIFNTVDIFENAFAFGTYKGENQAGDAVVGAQAANELLEIDGVKASFVFTEVKNKVFISARSIDEVNVQIILEKMGGGGHLTVAGAQLEGYTLEEAIEYTKKVIKEMIAEGEI